MAKKTPQPDTTATIKPKTTIKPIGVPDNYAAATVHPGPDPSNPDIAYFEGMGVGVNRGPTTTYQPARYYDGAQYDPASRTPDEIIDLQHALDAAGFYDSSARVVQGSWGPDDVQAYTRALMGANSSGLTDTDYLTQRISAMQANPAKKQRAPLVIKLTHEDDIRTVARQVSRDLYGGNLPEGDINTIISGFHGLESSSQQAAYDAGDAASTGVLDAGAGGTITKAPDPSSYIEQTIRKTHPNEVAATQFGAALDQIVKNLGATNNAGARV